MNIDAAGKLLDGRAWMYDALMDWDRRLAQEGPVFDKWCRELGARRVLDAACGSGRHAAMLHGWGLTVEGADISADMIAQARALWGEPTGLAWKVRGFDQPVDQPGSFDLCLCIGNSLALARDPAVMARAVACLLQAVRPGGMVVIQLLNLWRLAEGPIFWQKHKRLASGDHRLVMSGDLWISKGVHRCGGTGYVDVVALDQAGNRVHGESTPFAGVEMNWLLEAARRGGAEECTASGNYAGEAYQRVQSQDLVLRACKRGGRSASL